MFVLKVPLDTNQPTYSLINLFKFFLTEQVLLINIGSRKRIQIT